MTDSYKPQNLDTWLRGAARGLRRIGIASANLDAEIIASKVLNEDRVWVHAHRDHILDSTQASNLAELLERRENFEPIAYIVGKKEFYGREYIVDKRVLVPRPESESIIELAKTIPGKQLNVIDIGTGSGILGITLALIRPNWRLFLCDDSQEALAVASINIKKLGIKNIELLRQDLLGDYKIKFDVVIANLPYVPESFRENDDLKTEPPQAIFAGEDGLAVYRRLFRQLSTQPSKPNYLIIEGLEVQHNELTLLAARSGYKLMQPAGLALMFTLG